MQFNPCTNTLNCFKWLTLNKTDKAFTLPFPFIASSKLSNWLSLKQKICICNHDWNNRWNSYMKSWFLHHKCKSNFQKATKQIELLATGSLFTKMIHKESWTCWGPQLSSLCGSHSINRAFYISNRHQQVML